MNTNKKQISLVVTGLLGTMLTGCLSQSHMDDQERREDAPMTTLGRLSIDLPQENDTLGAPTSKAPAAYALPEGTVSVFRALGEKDAQSADVLKKALVGEAVGRLNQYGSEQLSAASHGGRAEVGLSANLDEGLSGNVRILTPLYRDKGWTVFTQEGVLKEKPGDGPARTIGHVGLGVRYFPWAFAKDSRHWMVGANLFLDQDFTRHHRRLSLGGEVAGDTLMLSGNLYRRLSQWRSSTDFDGAWVEERPADGWDLRGKLLLNPGRTLSLSTKVGKWKGDRVSSMGSLTQLATDPTVYGVGLEYRPVPAIVLTAEHERDSDHDKNTRVGVHVDIPFTDSWRQAFRSVGEGAALLETSFADGFVERDYTMPLAYRAKPGRFHIVSCGRDAEGRFCARITDGFARPAVGVPVSIHSPLACVKLDEPREGYVTGEDGAVTFAVLSSCTKNTLVRVRVGNSEATLPIVLADVTWGLTARPATVNYNGETVVTLSTGEVPVPGVPVRWKAENGTLTQSDVRTDAQGLARAHFLANVAGENALTANVRAAVEGGTFMTPITVHPMHGVRTLTITPETVTHERPSEVRLEGLAPQESVDWKLSSNHDVELTMSDAADHSSGRTALRTRADERGVARVYLRAKGQAEGEALVQLSAQPQTGTVVRETFTVIHKEGEVTGSVQGKLKLRIAAKKLSLPRDAMSGNQTLTLTLSGGQKDERIEWQVANGTLSEKETRFDRCGGRGCTSSVELTGAVPYQGEALVTAKVGGETKTYRIDYRNYDQGHLASKTGANPLAYDTPYEVVLDNILPHSRVTWTATDSARPTSLTSEADELGHAVMMYEAVKNYDLDKQTVSATYQRNAAETKSVTLDIPLEDWTQNVKFMVSKEVLVKDESVVFALEGGKPGASVAWKVEGPGERIAHDLAFDGSGRATLTLRGATPWEGKTVVTAIVRKKNLNKTIDMHEYRYEYCERCLFGQEALVPSGKVQEVTRAKATASFPAKCVAPQGTSETVTCNEVRVGYKRGCQLGQKTVQRVNGGAAVLNDRCPKGDILAMQYKCGNPAVLTVQANGYPPVFIREKGISGRLTNKGEARCLAEYHYIKRECSGETCTATLEAKIFVDNTPLSTMRGSFTIPNEAYVIEQTLKDSTWEDHCAPYRQ